MDVSTEILRKQVMVGQFVNAVGCSPDEATQMLTSARWQLEVALSIFFQGHSVVSSTTSTNSQATTHHASTSTSNYSNSSGSSSLGSRMSYQACVPTNTPATPPQFPDTLAAFAQLQTSSPSGSGSGGGTSPSLLQEPAMVHCQTQVSKS